MSADMHIHAITKKEKPAFIELKRPCLGSKYFSLEKKQDIKKFGAACETLMAAPNIWVGEVSWLKAAIFDDSETFVPNPIREIHEIIGEDFPVCDDEIIAKIAKAMDSSNSTGYALSGSKDIIKFLNKNKGKFLCTVSW